MAAIDDNLAQLAFTVQSDKSPERIAQLAEDASDMAGAGGGKVTLTPRGDGSYQGLVKNFIRVTHATFALTVTSIDPVNSRVTFAVGDYLRVRDTFMFIPIGPWQAPAYKPLTRFVEYLREKI